jgi:zinc protease
MPAPPALGAAPDAGPRGAPGLARSPLRRPWAGVFPPGIALAGLLAAGCAPAAASEQHLRNIAIPVRDPSPRTTPEDEDTREDPPDADPERPFVLPRATRERLAQGAEVRTLTTKGGPPSIEVRLVVGAAGSSADGDRPGLACVAARVAASGGGGKLGAREHAERLEALGARLSAEVFPEATIFSLSAPRRHLAEALELAISSLRDPRLEAEPIARAKKRERVLALAEGGGREASIAMSRALLGAPQAAGAAAAAAIDLVSQADLRAFFKQRYGPASLGVVAVGDVDQAEVRAATEKAISTWKSPAPAAPASPASPASPAAPPGGKTRVVVIDTPAAPLAELSIGAAGPPRAGEAFGAAAVLASLLGGGPSARLGQALRDAHPLGARASVAVDEIGRGPSVLVARFSAEPARAGLAIASVLDELKKAEASPATEPELAGARRLLEARLGLSTTSPSAQADALARVASLGLPDDALARLVERARAADGAAVQQAAHASFGAGVVVVAVADARVVVGPLSRFGEVEILSADRLERVRVVAANPQAQLEPPAPAASGEPPRPAPPAPAAPP